MAYEGDMKKVLLFLWQGTIRGLFLFFELLFSFFKLLLSFELLLLIKEFSLLVLF
jgi:hypothetical protein